MGVFWQAVGYACALFAAAVVASGFLTIMMMGG